MALAFANLAGVFDLGLRNAGHAELLAGEMRGPDPLRATTLTLATALESCW